MNKNALLALLAVLVVAAGAAYFLVERRGRPTRQTYLWSGAPSTAKRIVITKPDGRLSLARENGAWQVVEPVSFPANANILDSFLERLPKVTLAGPLSQSAERHATFGLDAQGSIRVQLEAEQDADFHVGKAGGDYDSIYVRVGDAPQVYEARGLSRYDVERSSTEWLSKEILNVPPTALESVTLKSSHTIRLAAQPGGGWKLADKGVSVSTAPGSPVNMLQGALADLEGDRVEIGAAPKGKPLVEVTVGWKDRGKSREDVLLIYPEKDGALPVVKQGEARARFLVHSWKLDAFRKPPAEFR